MVSSKGADVSDLEGRCGLKISADDPLWFLDDAVRELGDLYVQTEGGRKDITSGCLRRGVQRRDPPFGETALFNIPASHAGQIAAASLRHEGE